MMAMWLAGPVVPIAWCWRVERRDGVTVGFTTHDAPLLIHHQTYSPSPGIRPSAIHQREGLQGDTFDIEGALSGDAITIADLSQGRWDNAALTLFVTDWESPDTAAVVIASGRIGGVDSDGRGFSAELAGRDPMLDTALVPETSAECRAELGDRRCGIAMAGRRHRASIVSVDGGAIVCDRSLPAGDLSFGQLRWLSGLKCGLAAVIIGHDANGISIAGVQASAADVGAMVELTEGCDKRAATCAARFANIANFRGEPHLPGLDLLTRFPGG